MTDASHADPARLLVVEDDPSIGTNLVRALSNAGYACQLVATAADARSATVAPHLVLLDLGLPDGDGLDVLRDLHARWPAVPVIVLTARAEEMDIVIGLDAGAVDYIPKPFRLAELLARIRVHLRTVAPDAPVDTVVDGDLMIDVGSRRAFLRGDELTLRTKEFDLLATLVRHKGTAMTREDLMAEVWDEHWFGPTKTLDVHIAAVRRRLGEEPGAPSRITTLRGVGYRWEPTEPDDR